MELFDLTGMIVDAAYKIHRALGPGLLESAYEHCLAYELGIRGLAVRRQVVLPVVYEDTRVDAGYRLDMVVEDRVIVEVKAVATVTAIHTAQLITYLKLSKLEVGLMLNFNVVRFADGIRRLKV